MSCVIRLFVLIRPVSGIEMALLCGSAATIAFDPERTTVFPDSGSERRMYGTFNVFVEAPTETDNRKRFRTVPYEELDAFIRDNPKYRTRTDPREECFPVSPFSDGTQTCVAARGGSGKHVLEVTQKISGDSIERSIYNVTPSGVTRISHHFVHGMSVTGTAMGVFLAGISGLVLGLKPGTKLNRFAKERLAGSDQARS